MSVLFFVSYNTLFVSLVPRDRYVEASSLLNGSRALSFVGGPSLGGALVQVLNAPVTLVVDAFSFLGSAFSLSRISPPSRRPSPPSAGSRRRHALHPAARRSCARRSPRPRRSTSSTSSSGRSSSSTRTASSHVGPGALGLVLGAGVDRQRARIARDRPPDEDDRRRAGVRRRLRPLPGTARARAAGRRPTLGRARLSLPGRVRVRLRRDDPRHLGRLDQGGARTGSPARARLRCVHGRELRRPAVRCVRRAACSGAGSACARRSGSRPSARSQASSGCCRRRSRVLRELPDADGYGALGRTHVRPEVFEHPAHRRCQHRAAEIEGPGVEDARARRGLVVGHLRVDARAEDVRDRRDEDRAGRR